MTRYRGRLESSRGAVLMGLVALTSFATACASGPRTDVASREVTTRAHGGSGVTTLTMESETRAQAGTVVRPRSEVWSQMPALFERLGIDISFSDARSFAMGNRGTRVRRVDGERMAKWLDCGFGTTAQPYANQYDVTMGIEVRLVDMDGSATEVHTIVEASAKPMSHSGHAVQCSSKGTLEIRVADLLHELTSS